MNITFKTTILFYSLKENNCLIINVLQVVHRIFNYRFSDIQYLESKGNFVRLHCEDTRLMTAYTLSNMEQKLTPYGFLRVHKSFIVNLGKVIELEGNRLLKNNLKIPIGNSYKQGVLKMINN